MNGTDTLEALIVKDGTPRKDWVEKLRDWGFLDVTTRKPGEIIEIRTHPTEYYFEIIDSNSWYVNVESKIDEDFQDGHPCRFIGSMWIDPSGTLKQNWENAGVKIFGYLVKNFCPVVQKGNDFHVLPPVIQVVIGGEEFFRKENGDM